MADPELEEIRKQRLAQMQAQYKVLLVIYKIVVMFLTDVI